MGEFLYVFSGAALAGMILFVALAGKLVAEQTKIRIGGRALISLGFAAFLAAGSALPPEEGPYPDWLRHDRQARAWEIFGAFFVACLIGTYLAEGKRTRTYSRADDEG